MRDVFPCRTGCEVWGMSEVFPRWSDHLLHKDPDRRGSQWLEIWDSCEFSLLLYILILDKIASLSQRINDWFLFIFSNKNNQPIIHIINWTSVFMKENMAAQGVKDNHLWNLSSLSVPTELLFTGWQKSVLLSGGRTQHSHHSCIYSLMFLPLSHWMHALFRPGSCL